MLSTGAQKPQQPPAYDVACKGVELVQADTYKGGDMESGSRRAHELSRDNPDLKRVA